jgi:hypothetical protein
MAPGTEIPAIEVGIDIGIVFLIFLESNIHIYGVQGQIYTTQPTKVSWRCNKHNLSFNLGVPGDELARLK